MASKGVLDFTLDDEELKFQADAAKGPTPVPVGWYNVLITDVSIAPWSKDEPINPKTKKPVREKLVLTVKLSEGEFAGRQVRYVNVPLFQKFNPTAKSPAGTATSFISFMDAVGAIEQIARVRGCILKGRQRRANQDDDEMLDMDKASIIFLTDYRSGILGNISLETPQTRELMLGSENGK